LEPLFQHKQILYNQIHSELKIAPKIPIDMQEFQFSLTMPKEQLLQQQPLMLRKISDAVDTAK
jgi:hypothetical protein